jgi:hypothetical protein
MSKPIETKAQIIDAIKRLQRTGKPLNYSGIRKLDPRLLIKAREKFGNWRKAVEAAGFDYDKVSLIHRWSKREIIEKLKQLYRQRAFPDISTLSRKNHKLYEACCRHFGSGVAALEAAGIDYEELLNEHPYRWTRAQIVAEFKRRYNEGKTLRRSEILRKEPKLHRFCYAVLHQFGSWNKALRAAQGQGVGGHSQALCRRKVAEYRSHVAGRSSAACRGATAFRHLEASGGKGGNRLQHCSRRATRLDPGQNAASPT